MLYNPNTRSKFPLLKLDLIHTWAAAPARTFSALFHFGENLIWIQIAWEGAEVQDLWWDTDYEHENHFLHLFAAHPPSFCHISQLFNELFQNCKMRLGSHFFCLWCWSFNWPVNILSLLPLMTFASLCVFQGWMSVWSTTVAALMCVWTNQSALTASVPLAISSWTERLVAVNEDADRLGNRLLGCCWNCSVCVGCSQLYGCLRAQSVSPRGKLALSYNTLPHSPCPSCSSLSSKR